jgi:hypothetical protein
MFSKRLSLFVSNVRSAACGRSMEHLSGNCATGPSLRLPSWLDEPDRKLAVRFFGRRAIRNGVLSRELPN